MASLAVAAWLVVVGATGDLAVDTTVRLSGGARRTVPQTGPASTTGEAELATRLALHRDGLLRVSLSYEPRLRLPVDVSASSPELRGWTALERRLTVVHEAQVSATRSMGNGTRSLGGSARGAYGEVELFSLEEGSAQPIATTRRIAYQHAQVLASAAGNPTRRTSYSAQATAFLTGGAGEAARAVLPLQRVISLDGALHWGVTPRETLSAVVNVTGSRVEREGDAGYLLAGGGWRHLVRPTLSVRGAAGVAATLARDRDGGDTLGAVPWVEAALSNKPEPPRLSTEIRLAAEPGIDRLTGAIDARATADAWARWQPVPPWSFEAHASVAALRAWGGFDTFTSRGGPYTLVGTGKLLATRRFRARVAVSAGVRSAAQRTDRPDLTGFREIGGFVELTAGAASRL